MPNSPLRAAAVALAAGQTAGTGAGTTPPESGGPPAALDAMAVATLGAPSQPEPTQPALPKRSAHIQSAVLIARIDEVLPLLCPLCSGQMRIIAFITCSADIRHMLEHIGAETEPPRIGPVRGPPLWDGCDVPLSDGVEVEPDWDEAAQLALDFEVGSARQLVR